jgi:hypothetical protein
LWDKVAEGVMGPKAACAREHAERWIEIDWFEEVRTEVVFPEGFLGHWEDGFGLNRSEEGEFVV